MVDTERQWFGWERKAVSKEESFRVESELSFNPETPPIEQVVMANMRIVDQVTEAVAGGVAIRGRLVPTVMYKSLLGEEEEITQTPVYSMDHSEGIPFEHVLELPPISADSRWKADISITKSIVERELHHSIHVDSELSVILSVWVPEKQEFIAQAKTAEPSELNVAKDVFRVVENLGHLEGETVIKTDLDLPYLRPPIARVLWSQVQPTKINWEVIGGKINMEGSLIVGVTYVSSDDQGQEGPIEMVEWGRTGGSSLQWRIEIKAEEEITSVLPQVYVKNIGISMIGSEGIRLEAVLTADVQLEKDNQGEVVIDLASSELLLDIEHRTVEVEDIVGNQVRNISVEQLLEVPAGRPEIGRIVAYRMTPKSLKAECVSGNIVVEGATGLHVAYLALDEERFPGVYTADWDGSTEVIWSGNIDLPAAEGGMKAEVEGVIQEALVDVVDGRKLRFFQEISARAKAIDTRSLVVVADWAVVPQETATDRPSMIFYLTQPGDSYWTVARKYQTTMEALAKGNHLSLDEPLPIGKRLIIPTAV